MRRREFVKSVGRAAAGLTILPSGTLFGQNPPSNRLNLALIGVWGRGTAHYNWLKRENVVAVCDVNETRLQEGVQIFPGATTYTDWRRLLDQKNVEGIVICTPDHHHAFIANWAMNRGMHVYCEKPMGICVEEVRILRANYLRQKSRIATQHGTQRHAYPNFERVRELVLDGAVGELKRISGWDARELPRPGYPAGEGTAPSILQWEQWLGPSPYHPYSPQYFGGGNGMNCIYWNMYRDFGVGQMGDMGAHTMDLLWNAIDAGAPSAIDVDFDVSDEYNPDINPVKLKATFEHPANSWRGPVTVDWYQGGLKPESPRQYLDLSTVDNGAIFEGNKGYIFCDFTSRMIIPSNDDGDMTYYARRSSGELLPLVGDTGQPSPRPRPRSASQPTSGNFGIPMGDDGFPIIKLHPGDVPPALGDPNPGLARAAEPYTPSNQDLFMLDWVKACKGESDNVTHGTSSKTHCDFDYSGTMMEQMLLGLVAHRAGKRLEYDAVAGRVTNAPEANDYLKRTYREGWTLNG